MSSKNRATQAELILRREEIQVLILQGVKSYDIQKILAEKYKTSVRAIANDIREVSKEWEDKADESKALLRNKYADRLELMFNEAMTQGHVKTALEIQKEIHKLNGLYTEKESDKDEVPKFINITKRGELKVVGDNES